MYDLHITSLEYVARRISVLVKQEKAAKVKDAKNRAMRKRYQALSFFRVLMHLLGPVTGKDALRIKSHLEEAIKSTEAPISVNKNWDSYRMYERKLVTLASRDPNVKMASKRMVAEADDTDEPLISASVPIPKRSIREPVLYGDDLGNEEGGNPAATRTKKKQSARRPIADERDLDENEEDEEDLADPHDSARSRSSPESAKRSLPIEDDSGFQPMSDVDLNLDMDFELDLPGSQDTARARSVSIEPTAKKRRTVRRF